MNKKAIFVILPIASPIVLMLLIRLLAWLADAEWDGGARAFAVLFSALVGTIGGIILAMVFDVLDDQRDFMDRHAKKRDRSRE